MAGKPLQVLVVDDSALMRNLVSRIIDSEPDISVAGKAMNGRFALQKITTLDPDVIVLDLEMPEMNGLEFLKERRTLGITIPVVVLSAVAQRGASITMDALTLGASDFIPKPTGRNPEEIRTIGAQLVEMIRAYGTRYRREQNRGPIGTKPPAASPAAPGTAEQEAKSAPFGFRPRPADAAGTRRPDAQQAVPGEHRTREPYEEPPAARKRVRRSNPGPLEIIAIGISTGGPNALRQVFSQLTPAVRVPILVVQHMPPGFTSEFAKSLDRICPLEVKEAQDGDLVKPGRILIAPGDYHMRVERRSLATIVRLESDPPVNGHRPSADILFSSSAEVYGNRALGIIMTGMGKDGADKLGEIYEAGGMTLGQDQNSSVVYGMPRVAFEYGNVVRQVALDDMAKTITDLVRELAPSR